MGGCHVGDRRTLGVHGLCTIFALSNALESTKTLDLVVSSRLGLDQFWAPARCQDPRRVLSLANLVEVGCADPDRPELQVIRVCTLARVSKEPVTWVLRRDACLPRSLPSCLVGHNFPSIFWQLIPNWFCDS